MNDRTELEEFDRRIVDSVSSFWDEHRKPMLLSLLGNVNNGEVARFAKQEAGNLTAYLRSRLSEHLQIVQHSIKTALIGVMPVDAGSLGDGGTSNIDELLDRTRRDSIQRTPRYHPAFWAAFRVPLDESGKRYVQIVPPFHFHDSAAACAPPRHLEIDSDYIAPAYATASEVQDGVQRWLTANSLGPDRFLSSATAVDTRIPSSSLLDRLLSTLEHDDLKRISMPLDIVDRLRRERL